MTRQLSHKEGSFTVNGDIEGVMCPMVVDTGTNITGVHPDVLSKQTLSHLQATKVYSKVCGKLRLWVRIGGTQVLHEVHGCIYFQEVHTRPRRLNCPQLYRWCRSRKPRNWNRRSFPSSLYVAKFSAAIEQQQLRTLWSYLTTRPLWQLTLWTTLFVNYGEQ